MTRNRASAKQAGASFERVIADCLAEHVDDRIDRRVKRGRADRGDIAGVRLPLSRGVHTSESARVVIECKNTKAMALGPWVNEAEVERGNDDALVGLVIHKRVRVANPLDQYVTCTVRDLVALLTGSRPDA